MELNRIYNEDCLVGMKEIPDESIDCIICDLPYGTTACAWDSVIPFEPLWEQYNRICKDTAPIILFGSQPFTSMLISSNISQFREELCWLKNKPASGFSKDSKHLKLHENIIVFSKSGKPTFNPQKWLVDKKEFLTQRKTFKDNEFIGNNIYGSMHRTRPQEDGTRYPISVVCAKIPHCQSYSKEYKSDLDQRFHPTQKPVELIRYLVRTYSNPGDTILDNCMGSGTTAVAAVLEKRKFIGFETDKEYYDKANKRLRDLTGPFYIYGNIGV